MKKNETTAVSGKVLYLKIARIMKLMIALLMIACLQVSAKGWSQDRITLKMSEAEIKKVLFAIEKKSDYRFLFSETAIKGKPRVNVDVVEAPISEVLDRILANTGVSYKILGTNLVVLKEGIAAAAITSQEIRVSGKVTAEGGEILSGVSVSVKGSRTGTTTDVNGNYSISVPDDAVLVFSSVGYETQEVAVAGKTNISVILQQSSRKIDEVVVIGYGTANKRDLTGSIVKISGKDVADKPNTNPVASLQGRVAGLSVVNNGTPGQAPDIRIRGTISIGSVKPLYVVDGVFNDNIDYLNPNDIESIEILKDPSSLAIFGVRGAAGVIAITTKRAKAGQVTVNYNNSFGTKQLVDKIKLANAEEFKTLYEEEKLNIGANTPFDYSKWTANTDWIDAVTRTGNFNSHNLSVSASTEKNKFNMGIGYVSDEGIIRHQKLEKILFSMSDELKISKAIKIGFNFNGVRQNNPYGYAADVLNDARKVAPIVPSGTKTFYTKNPYGIDSLNQVLYYELPSIQNSGVVNPLVRLENEWDKTINIEYRTVASVFAEVNFLRDFTFKSTLYADISNVNRRQYVPLYYTYDAANDAAFLTSPATKVFENDDTYRKFQQDHILSYKKNFGNHNLNLVGGFTTYYRGKFLRSASVNQSSTGAAIPDDKRFWYINNGFGDVQSQRSSSSQSEATTVSGLFRALYNFQNKYYLNASFRRDASSQISPANRSQNFWAVGAAWELTKEGFMQDQKIFDFLKLKASIGVLGNQNIEIPGLGTDYPFYPGLVGGAAAVFGNNIYTAYQQAFIPDPNLKWETVSAKEVGVELSAFSNRLRFEASYFDKLTKDLMTLIPGPSGTRPGLTNIGSIKNNGLEFSASWVQKLTKDMTLTIGGNLTTYNNKVVELATKDFAIINGFNRTVVGEPIGSFYGYIVEGIYQSYADVLASPINTEFSYGPGDLKYKDINGDGVINTADRSVIGNPTPDFAYGGNINLTYKGFDLGIDVNGVYGNEIYRNWGGTESPFQRVNYAAFKVNRWRGEGTSNWDPILAQDHRINYEASTYGIEDGSYFRIRNIQVGYNFSPQFASKLKAKNFRLFANIQNLKTFKNNLGYTPEFGGSAISFGVDNAGGAIPVVSTFGLNITF
ncbi:MAG: TonB-dependent receptor [Chitinophagales bacterium]|nr:TonB-dependent receptor [Chitinophagales bacterium]